MLSPTVPKALRVLGFNTTHVGSVDDGVPPRGSKDEDILDYAKNANQIIVTSNHDMMTICAAAGERFVWLYPRGKKLSRLDQVLLVFRQIELWEQILTEYPQHCVHALRTKADPIDPEEAARLAARRMKDLERRKRGATGESTRSPLPW